MDSDIFLLSISGHDKPGLTSSLTAVLAEYDANVLDIGQANIHDTLSLGILFQIKSGKKSAAVLKDILFKSYELGIKAKLKPIIQLRFWAFSSCAAFNLVSFSAVLYLVS